MAQRCTVCDHPKRAEIDAALTRGESAISLAAMYSLHRDALYRHKARHLPELIAAARIARNSATDYALEAIEARQARAVDIFAELSRAIERMNLLSDACDRWLRDPDDATRYDVGTRAEDVLVIYLPDGEKGKPKRVRLSVLLAELRDKGRINVLGAEYQSADPRELILKAHAGAKTQLELLVAVLDKLHNARQMQEFEASVLAAIAEVSPDVRDRIAASLESSQRLRTLAGWYPTAVPNGAGGAFAG